MLYWTPALLIAGCVIAGVFWRSILFLQPPQGISSSVRPVGIAGGLLLASIPVICWVSLSVQPKRLRGCWDVIAFTCAFALTLLTGFLLDQDRMRFVLEEAVKSRATQTDFTRNIAFKQQLLRQHRPEVEIGKSRVLIIGSSQINLGIDAQQLQKDTGSEEVLSACMPGMVPLQYLALSGGVVEQRPTHVVCWLSEFDFFRETSLPTVRLRWCMDRENLIPGRFRRCRPRSGLEIEAKIADLTTARFTTLWQQRSLVSFSRIPTLVALGFGR